MAKSKSQGGIWTKSFLNSRIKSANTEGKEGSKESCKEKIIIILEENR